MNWQVYGDIEKEIRDLSYSVSFCKENKAVFSPRIAELIVRIGFQIESILQKYSDKEKNSNYKTLIKKMIKQYKLDEKCIFIDDTKIFSDGDYEIFYCPFKTEEDKVSYKKDGVFLYAYKNNPTVFMETVPENERCSAYPWENAYNNLKHDFYSSLKKYGTVRYLISILSALYILNIYLDEDLKKKERYFGMQYETLDFLYKKSSFFRPSILEGCIKDDIIEFNLIDNRLKYDNYMFINVNNFELYKLGAYNYLSDDWELSFGSDNSFIVPEYIRRCLPDSTFVKNYCVLIRNEIKEENIAKSYQRLLRESN